MSTHYEAPIIVPVPCDCGEFNHATVTFTHGAEPVVSLPACRTCGTPMEPMRDDIVDTAICAVMDGIA